MASKRKQSIHTGTMSAQTKKFLQKICYKETASVDMTKYGFVNDKHHIRVFIQPLRTQLEKLHYQTSKIGGDVVDSEKIPKINVKTKTQYKKTFKNGKKSNL